MATASPAQPVAVFAGPEGPVGQFVDSNRPSPNAAASAASSLSPGVASSNHKMQAHAPASRLAAARPPEAESEAESYEELRLSTACSRLPVSLAVAIPAREFRVRHLLALVAGEVIETQWGQDEDLPLSSGPVQLAWSEFEVIDTRLAVRVTRLA